MGIALKKYDPEFLKSFIEQTRVEYSESEISDINRMYDELLLEFQGNSCFEKHLSLIEKSIEGFRSSKTVQEWQEPTEPWASINHGDFWTNNLLFHKNDEGRVDDVKFIDFQMYFYTNPLRDLPFFLCNLDDFTRQNHVDKLLNLYYDIFIETLIKMKCDVVPFSRESFDLALQKEAVRDFAFTAFVNKFISHEAEKNEKDVEQLVGNVLKRKLSDNCKNKWLKIIDLFEKKGWF